MSFTHRTAAGEPLSCVARSGGTSTSALQLLNGLSSPNALPPGSLLLLAPPPKPPQAAAAAQSGRQAAQKASQQQPQSCVTACPFSGAGKVRAGGDDNIDVLYALAKGEGQKAGWLGHAKAEAGVGLLKTKHEGHFGNSSWFGGSHKMESLSAEAKATGGVVQGAGGAASAKAAVKTQEASMFVGKDAHNPWAEAGGEYSLLQAEAKGDALLGSDGKRAGVALGGKAGAAAASGDLKGEINIPIPFTDWTLSMKAKGGASAGSVGAGGSAHMYKDLESGRYHGGVGMGAAVLLGLEGDVDLSVGPRYKSRERPGS